MHCALLISGKFNPVGLAAHRLATGPSGHGLLTGHKDEKGCLGLMHCLQYFLLIHIFNPFS